jgi:RimJ/RimL family protein N-acetyltransferase
MTETVTRHDVALGAVGAGPKRQEGTMPVHGSSEEREYATLVAELAALGADIEAAHAIAPRATHGVGLGFRARREPARAGVHGEHVRLKDGADIVLRPVEPGDRDELRIGFEHLSAVSRFRRFGRRVDHLSSRELAEMTNVDHESHEAIAALVAATGEGIGIARYIRAPDDPLQAEFTCTVADSWQRRGVGTALIERLAARARAAGIERFTTSIVVGNEPARRLLAHVADEVSEHREGGTVEIVARRRDTRS